MTATLPRLGSGTKADCIPEAFLPMVESFFSGTLQLEFCLLSPLSHVYSMSL